LLFYRGAFERSVTSGQNHRGRPYATLTERRAEAAAEAAFKISRRFQSGYFKASEKWR
jgi:hypothetical protein